MQVLTGIMKGIEIHKSKLWDFGFNSSNNKKYLWLLQHEAAGII
jgi:hypothetical protein